MSTATDSARPADPGLEALVMLLHFHGVGADPARSGTSRERTDRHGGNGPMRQGVRSQGAR